ncbi:Nuclear transport factor 2 [Erysiphe neolycopersici]|uniref:Nuclear transport factor 2 n=1 Tax=Erysiphe neolycopersici TaxID=212602 RepID=A0A420HXR8_9PEZI|nr:Nuclear transport factor 2 [Erysiphe neolycopersici]
MSDFNIVAQDFTTFYYDRFDVDRKALASLYRDESMLTFETSSVKGAKNIVEKLDSLPFGKVKHIVVTLDAQPSGDHGGILILVTGNLMLENEERPMGFTQVFQLLPNGVGSYFVYNDIFKLVFS